MGSLRLLETTTGAACNTIVFSSPATVYGEPQYLPIDKGHHLKPVNPKRRTKLMAEHVISGWCSANAGSSAALLRCFYPVGAHPSGRLGEDPSGIPDNLMPCVVQVAVGWLPHLNDCGNDYDTRDGAGERDYIQVVDLAQAHLAALDFVGANPGCEVFNVGTGTGYSLLDEVIDYSEACGRDIPYVLNKSRTGDVEMSFAVTTKAGDILPWRAEHGLFEMCRSSWNWQSRYLDGYKSQYAVSIA